jgi:Alr-MurF fusion protein
LQADYKLKYILSDIARIINAEASTHSDVTIEHLLLDSRKVYAVSTSLFFALKGFRKDGHQFIPELYKKGVRNFVVNNTVDKLLYPEGNFLLVNDTLAALQELSAHHRRQFNIPVIGITGSNGKTIVKEWLYQLLQEDYNIVRSPKSYNSQIGVPLSVWGMNEKHTLAIFEAGVSEQGEMLRLERIIRPTIGVLTNIGAAHSEGFVDDNHKFREKLTLFKNSAVIIGREKDLVRRPGVSEVIEMFSDSLQLLSWGDAESENEFVIRVIEKKATHTNIVIDSQLIEIPFTDDASIENAITCYCVLRELNIVPEIITQRMKNLQPVNMRLELKKGINHCSIINDSYSADLSSLEIALNFLDQQSAGAPKTVILSDFLQSSLPDEQLYATVVESLIKHNVKRFIAIGEKISTFCSQAVLEKEAGFTIELFPDTDTFLQQFRASQFKDEVILVKGARVFAFEEIVQLLEQKVHQTILEINLNAIAHNLKEYQQLLKPTTKVMAMVKAFAYGSGGAEVAGILQYHKADYLGVAYADEGVELRKAGITLPIMVMNPEENAFDAIIEHNLEPELYSFALLQSFDIFLKKETLQQYPVHIEIETGMNRLGFSVDEISKLAVALNATPSFKIQTVFSHLTASEEAAQDAFTLHQFQLFEKAAALLEKELGYPVIKHISNSAAVQRHPQLQMDMVRLGIGLYGVDSAASNKLNLQTVTTLKSTIAQLKYLKAGDSVSYNRKGMVNKDAVIATVRIGYADGYPRRLGNGVGKVWIGGQLVPIIGTICMDMFMVDVTDVQGVKEGDEVIVFGKQLPVQLVAEWDNTISYEIMTGISQRVKRVYFEE